MAGPGRTFVVFKKGSLKRKVAEMTPDAGTSRTKGNATGAPVVERVGNSQVAKIETPKQVKTEAGNLNTVSDMPPPSTRSSKVGQKPIKTEKMPPKDKRNQKTADIGNDVKISLPQTRSTPKRSVPGRDLKTSGPQLPSTPKQSATCNESKVLRSQTKNKSTPKHLVGETGGKGLANVPAQPKKVKTMMRTPRPLASANVKSASTVAKASSAIRPGDAEHKATDSDTQLYDSVLVYADVNNTQGWFGIKHNEAGCQVVRACQEDTEDVFRVSDVLIGVRYVLGVAGDVVDGDNDDCGEN